MTRRSTLAARIGMVGGVLLLLALVSIGLTLWVSWQLEGGAAAVNESGRMRMQAWRMAQTLAVGDRALLAREVAQFDASLALLARGDPARPLFVPHDAASAGALAGVRRGWAELRSAWSAAAPVAPAQAARQAEGFVRVVDDFVTAIERQLARWTAVLHLFQFALLALAIGAAVALLYSAHLFVFEPLARLQAGLARLQAGDLAARVDVAGAAEFGAVAAGFNRMAATLQGLYQNLEAKVADRTERLQAERERVSALYEASAFVGRADTPEQLAQGFARQMRRLARADAAAVRLVDETSRRYMLAGSDCLPQSMLEYERGIGVGECLCGQRAGEAGMRVIPIRRESGDRRDGRPGRCVRCAEDGFEQLIGVPVRLHERTLGEVDLLYRGPVPLDREDRALLETLASHLAGALESQRAAALEREAAVAAERGLLARELHDSIAQSLAFLKIQVQLLRDAIARGEARRIERALGELDAGVRESTADVRELLVHFRTRTNAEDIVPALQTTLSKFEHHSGLASQLEVRGEGLPLAPDTQTQVLHVVQEALSNVRKHAAARAVHVTLERGPVFSIRVRDDGCGFATEAAAPDETHVGLRIMRERAARIGATVEVSSQPGAGTEVTLTVPQREVVVA